MAALVLIFDSETLRFYDVFTLVQASNLAGGLATTTSRSEGIAADYNAGVLKLKLAKRAEAKPKQIKVDVGTAKTIEAEKGYAA